MPRTLGARSRRVTEAEYMEVRAAEQAEIRRTFVADAGVPPKRAPRVERGGRAADGAEPER